MKLFLSKYFNLSTEECDLFISNANLLKFKKKDHLILAGTPVKKLFFIEKGLVRGYRLNDGIDTTHHFFEEKNFATDYESFLTKKKGELYLEALTNILVYEFDESKLVSFYQAHPKFEEIRFFLAEHAYLQMVERVKDLQTKELKERYSKLIHTNPDLFQHIPQKHIASYLGVMPQSLSRIKTSVIKT